VAAKHPRRGGGWLFSITLGGHSHCIKEGNAFAQHQLPLLGESEPSGRRKIFTNERGSKGRGKPSPGLRAILGGGSLGHLRQTQEISSLGGSTKPYRRKARSLKKGRCLKATSSNWLENHRREKGGKGKLKRIAPITKETTNERDGNNS